MIVVLLISALCLVLIYLETKHKLKHGMCYGFMLITVLYCIHYDFGTDYMTYYNNYQSVVRSNYSIAAVFDSENWRNGEFGWGLLQFLFTSILGTYGFFLMVAVISIVENVIIYRFIRKHLTVDNYVFAAFIYLFTSSFYLLGFSMMRQWFAMCLFLLAYDFIQQKRFLWSLAIIYIASIIHRTASILFPIAFISLLPMKYAKYYGFFLIVSFFALMFEGDVLDQAMLLFTSQSDTIEDYVSNYDRNNYEATDTFGVGFAFNTIPFVISIYYLLTSKDDEDQLLMVLIACIGSMIVPFAQALPMVKRMSLYFTLLTIGSVPIVYSNVKKDTVRWSLIVIFVFMQFVGYFGFFEDPSYKIHYSQFHTIFSQF